MAATWQCANGTTTEAGESRIRDFIQIRRKEIEYIESQITAEESRIITSDNAISNLELLIPVTKRVIDAHEENLEALISVKEASIFVKEQTDELLSLEMKPESKSEALLKEVRTCAIIPAAGNDDSIEDKLEILPREVRTLWDKLRELEMELEGWKLSRKLSKSVIQNLNSSKTLIEETVTEAKITFTSLWRIPVDVWIKIFNMVLYSEYSDYVKHFDGKTLRSMPYVLSHVCHRWRYIVHEEATELWNIVYAPPTQAWRQDEHDLLTSSIQKSNRPITLLVNLWQSFKFSYYQNQRYDQNGSWVTTLTPSDTLLTRSVVQTAGSKKAKKRSKYAASNIVNTPSASNTEYTLHIHMTYDDYSYLQRLSYIPFRQPTAIIFSATQPINQGYLLHYIPITTVKSLTIINDYPNALPSLSAGGTPPTLTRLDFRVKQLHGHFGLTEYLQASLEEAYLKQEITGTFPPITNGHQLPKLRVLGITPAALSIVQLAFMPELRTLILYGSNNPLENVQAASGTTAAQTYRRILHFEFRDWGKVEGDNVNAGPVALLEKLIPESPALHSIRFTDSFINGESLVGVISDAMQGNGVTKLKYLKEITLSGVDGIKRDDCDRIKSVVPKLSIYM